MGDKQYTYSFIGHDVNQTLSVLDGAPVVTLKGGSTAVYRLGGPKASDMAISAADVTAIDELDGELEASAITFTVKVPGSSEFVALELVGGKFVPDAIGEYVIRYVATDKGRKYGFRGANGQGRGRRNSRNNFERNYSRNRAHKVEHDASDGDCDR